MFKWIEMAKRYKHTHKHKYEIIYEWNDRYVALYWVGARNLVNDFFFFSFSFLFECRKFVFSTFKSVTHSILMLNMIEPIVAKS